MEGTLTDVLRDGWGMTAAVRPLRPRWFTGKVVARCDTPGGSWCPAGTPEALRARAAVAAVCQWRLTQLGCAALPAIRPARDGELLHAAGGMVWSLSAWREGAPEHDHLRWTAAMLEGLGGAVGELHRLGRDLVPPGAAPLAPPAQLWAGDWRGFDERARRRWVALLADPEVDAAPELRPLRESIERGLAALPSLAPPAVGHLTVAHDDLWTEHVLFAGGRLTAIIDLDGIAPGDGRGDLAALLSDFADLRPDRCAHVLRGYRTECDVSGDDLAAARGTVVRHHVAVLIDRVARWRERPQRRDELIAPVGFWIRSLRRAIS